MGTGRGQKEGVMGMQRAGQGADPTVNLRRALAGWGRMPRQPRGGADDSGEDAGILD